MNIVIDAAHAPVGRTASYAAKQALLGNDIVVVNAEQAFISGSKSWVAAEYVERRARGGTSQKGPNFPSRPEFIFKRTIRGMLSYKQGRGREAFKRIRCYRGVPLEFNDTTKVIMEAVPQGNYITLEQLSQRLK